jgi:thiamine kinase-like enzyme
VHAYRRTSTYQPSYVSDILSCGGIIEPGTELQAPSDYDTFQFHPTSVVERMETIVIENIESVTADLFSRLLRAHGRSESINRFPTVESLASERVDQGVLSQVYRVHLTFAGEVKNDRHDVNSSFPASDWMVKLVRKDLNLQWMCKNETCFYSQYAKELFEDGSRSDEDTNGDSHGSTTVANLSALPFAIPKFLDGSAQHIILQEVLNVQTFSLVGGCPFEKIDFLLQALAAWHAKCWKASCFYENNDTIKDDLVFPAGMGQRLPPLQKEGLFVTSWQETVMHTFVGSSSDDTDGLLLLARFATNHSRRLAKLRLRDVHGRVHQHRVTCVHGDYHVANWLFPRDGGDRTEARTRINEMPVLVDWATAGYGNPMIDLVFFLVVSTNDQVAAEAYQVWLPKYHAILVERLSLRGIPPTEFTLETMKEWFRWALLCQWLILVAYDNVCRQIAMSESDEGRRESQLEHFRNVNRRATLAMKNVDSWDETLENLPTTTAADRFEAQQFCGKHSLEI